MARIKVYAGDFEKIDSHFFFGMFMLYHKGKIWSVERIQAAELQSIDIASEASARRVGGILGWGLADAALLGPAGLLAGLLLGGRGEQVMFVAKFKDGRKLLAETDPKSYTQMQAAIF